MSKFDGWNYKSVWVKFIALNSYTSKKVVDSASTLINQEKKKTFSGK